MYDFIDVTESQDSARLPSEALSLNGEYIENLLPGYQTLSVSGRELLDKEIDSLKIGFSNGEKYNKKRFPSRAIIVQFQLLCADNETFRNRFNRLNEILNAEQAQLIFADEQDKYFIGTPENAGDVPPGRNSIVSSFSIYCADPFKYAVTPKTFPNNGDSTITIQNNGTAPAYVDIDATLKSDNGGLAFVTTDKMLGIGNFEEVDGETLQHSDGVIWSPMTTTNLNGWWGGAATPIVGNSGVSKMGALTSQGEQVDFKAYASPSDFGNSGSSQIYHGPAKMATLNQSGVNVSTTWVLRMYCRDSGIYTGHTQLCLIADDGTVVAYVEFAISNPQKQQGSCKVFVNGIKRWEFGMSFGYYNGYTSPNAPYLQLNKDGDTIIFVVGGNTLSFVDPDIGEMVVNRVSFQMAKWMTNNPCEMQLAVVAGYKNYTSWNDVPNFIKEHDVVKIRSESYEATINGTRVMINPGSNVLTVPPGETELAIVYSDWATMPEFTATIREVYL